jgi:hypothetical protein
MDPKTCCVCSEVFSQGSTFTLTKEERDLIGVNAPTEVHYCRTCLKAVQNLQQGAQILRGMVERGLRAAGVPNASRRATEFHTKLLHSATKKLQ